MESDTSSTSSPVRRGRGRGRGRGRPRGSGARGSGARGRGRRADTQERRRHRGDEAADALSERERILETRIEGMTDEERKDLLLKAGKKHPSLFMELIESVPHGGYHPQPGATSPNWCSCMKCREMPTAVERVCCGRPPNSCQSDLPDFRLLVLDELVLQMAQLYRQDVLALPVDDDYNKGKRHAAYRQFILWHHGRLGIGVRRVIPSCCVWAIRDKFPDQFGQYHGFVPSRLG